MTLHDALRIVAITGDQMSNLPDIGIDAKLPLVTFNEPQLCAVERLFNLAPGSLVAFRHGYAVLVAVYARAQGFDS